MSVDVLDLTCPKCGGTMEPDRKNGTLHCPFCNYEQLLMPDESDSIEEQAYARQRGVLRANEDAENAKKTQADENPPDYYRRNRIVLFNNICARLYC